MTTWGPTTIAAGADDAFERDDGSSFDGTGTSVLMDSNTSDASRANGGLRFVNVTVPQASTINSATLDFWPTSTNKDDPNMDIHFEDVDNSVNFTSNADVTSRTRTTASVQYTATGIGDSGYVASPDIASPVDEVVARGSFASGNALTALCDGKSDADFELKQRSYEGNSAEAVRLTIDYTAPAAVVFTITIPAAEGISGRMVHIKEVVGSTNTITIKAEDGVHTVAQTIERLSEITISVADGGVLLLADGISNWEIVARVNARATRTTTTITADTTLTIANDVVLVDASDGPVKVTVLPSAETTSQTLDIKKIDSTANPVTIDGATIDGGLTAVLTDEDESITIFSDGSEHRIL